MTTEPRSPRLAVLIDADNTSAKIADGLFEEIAKVDEASVRRIYGDFASPRSKGWTDVLSRHRRLLEPIGNIPPAEAEERYYAMLDAPAMAA